MIYKGQTGTQMSGGYAVSEGSTAFSIINCLGTESLWITGDPKLDSKSMLGLVVPQELERGCG